MRLTLSGTSHEAALRDVTPISERQVGFGRQVVLEAPDRTTYVSWIDRLAEAACDQADRHHITGEQSYKTAMEAIYRDLERAS